MWYLILKKQILSPKRSGRGQRCFLRVIIQHCAGSCSSKRKEKRYKQHKWWKEDETMILYIKRAKGSYKETNRAKWIWGRHRTQSQWNPHTHRHRHTHELTNNWEINFSK